MIICVEHFWVSFEQCLSSQLHKSAKLADGKPYSAWVFIGRMHCYNFHVCYGIGNRFCLCEAIPSLFYFVADLHNPLGWLIIQLFLHCPLTKLLVFDIELINAASIWTFLNLLLFSPFLVRDLSLGLLCGDLLHFALRFYDFRAGVLWRLILILHWLHLHSGWLIMIDIEDLIFIFIFEVKIVAATPGGLFRQCFPTYIHLLLCRLFGVATSFYRLGIALLLQLFLVSLEEMETVLQIIKRLPCGFTGRVSLPFDLILSDEAVYI